MSAARRTEWSYTSTSNRSAWAGRAGERTSGRMRASMRAASRNHVHCRNRLCRSLLNGTVACSPRPASRTGRGVSDEACSLVKVPPADRLNLRPNRQELCHEGLSAAHWRVSNGCRMFRRASELRRWGVLVAAFELRKFRRASELRRWGVLVAAFELRALRCRSTDLHGAGGLPSLQRRSPSLGP